MFASTLHSRQSLWPRQASVTSFSFVTSHTHRSNSTLKTGHSHNNCGSAMSLPYLFARNTILARFTWFASGSLRSLLSFRARLTAVSLKIRRQAMEQILGVRFGECVPLAQPILEIQGAQALLVNQMVRVLQAPL